MNRVLPLGFVLAVLIQQALAYARSSFVFMAVGSDEGITSAGMHIEKNSIFMFPALEVFERGADPIVVYYKDGQCHAENEFGIASIQVTIEQQFVSTGEWRNWVIQENGDIIMEKDRHSTFALVKSEGNAWRIVAEKWWEPHEGVVGAVQKGGSTVDFSLKVGALDTAVRLRMLNELGCEKLSMRQGIIDQ